MTLNMTRCMRARRVRAGAWMAGAAALVLCAAAWGVGDAARGVEGATAGPGRGPAKDMMPAVQLIGHDSKIADRRFVLLRDEGAWKALWAEHTGVPTSFGPPTRWAAPRVDFSRFMVVGAFNGAGTNSDGQIAQSVSAEGDAVRIRFETASFQTASMGPGPDRGVQTSCYGLWVIDRSDKPIVVEEARRDLKNEPVRWEEVQRFAGK